MIPEYFAYLSILFGIIGSFFYIKDIFLGKVKPNRVSWFLWMIAPFIGVYISYKSGVDILLLLSTFMAGFIPFLILLASLFKKKSYWKITTFDILLGLLSLLAIIIWITTKNGFLALIFAILADLFAGIPTILKSWKYSETENTAPYLFGILNQIITFLIITNFSFLNYGFPLYLILMNIIIVLGIKKSYFFK